MGNSLTTSLNTVYASSEFGSSTAVKIIRAAFSECKQCGCFVCHASRGPTLAKGRDLSHDPANCSHFHCRSDSVSLHLATHQRIGVSKSSGGLNRAFGSIHANSQLLLAPHQLIGKAKGDGKDGQAFQSTYTTKWHSLFERFTTVIVNNLSLIDFSRIYV